MASIKRNYIYNVMYQIFTIIVPLITTPYISRTVGANGVGTYSYSYSIASYFVMFIMLGLNNYGSRTIAKCSDNKIEIEHKFWSIYFLQFSLGVIVNSIYCIYIFGFSSNKPMAMIMWIYVISALLDVNWFFSGVEKFAYIVMRNVVVKLMTTILIFLCVKTSQDIYIYSLILVIGTLISQLLFWPYILKNVSFYIPSLQEILVHIKPNLILFLTVIAVSVFKVMDKIMLGLMTTKTQVGYYELSERIICIPTALITSLGTVMLPRMTKMMNKCELPERFLTRC